MNEFRLRWRGLDFGHGSVSGLHGSSMVASDEPNPTANLTKDQIRQFLN